MGQQLRTAQNPVPARQAAQSLAQEGGDLCSTGGWETSL